MKAQSIALAFSAILHDELTPQIIAEIVRLNVSEPDSAICHSHDFCDANEPMAAAFEAVMGRELELGSDSDCALWESAWNTAKASGFSVE